jgi:hypothetical protein
MSDLVSQPTGNKARHQTAQPHDRVVLADTARAELLRHVAARQSFADGPEYPLIEPVADEEYGEERYVSSECEAEVDGQGYCEGQDQNIPSPESVRQKSRRVRPRIANLLTRDFWSTLTSRVTISSGTLNRRDPTLEPNLSRRIRPEIDKGTARLLAEGASAILQARHARPRNPRGPGFDTS